LLNNEEHMTLGGIYNKQFTDWQPTKTALEFSTYFGSAVDGFYLVNASNIEFLPGFIYKTTAQGAKFKLAEDIDLSTIKHYGITEGEDYLAELSLKEFKGTFDGNGKTLSNLNIDQSFNGDIGLFGRVIDANISNLNISNPTLKGYYNIGSLAGYANRTNIDNVDVTSLTITGDSTLANGKMGGLIGHNTVSTSGTYTLQNSQVSGTINGFGSYIGGLVGHNEKIAISDSSANVAVTSTTGDNIGGLIGENSQANITGSSSTGLITATNRNSVGGLIGRNSNSYILDSFATGKVIGTSYIGGLIGYNTTSSTVNGSYATGDVEATGSYVGGLIGQNLSYSNIGNTSANYATGNVTGTYYVGGLIGQNSNSTVNNSYTGIKTDGTITTKAGTVIGTATTGYVGGLIGQNSSGNISNSIASGDVVSIGNYVGGFVGQNSSSTISSSSASGDVNGLSYIGGLIGHNTTNSAITSSSSSGNVIGTSQYIGGLVGYNQSNITSSSAIGNVTGKNSSDVYQNYVGGLVGYNTTSNITSSYHTTGKVMGLDYVGGLVGQNQGTSSPTYTINTSYASGEVEGRNYVGGLVGYSYYNSVITNSYVENESKVTGTRNVGGLVGMSDTTVIPTYPASITNSYYNVNGVTINGGNYVTLGGIYNKQFTDWMSASRTGLTASTYLGVADGSGFYTLNKNNIEYALAFANVAGMKFKLGETIDVSDITQAGTTDTKLTDWHLAEFRGTFDGNSKALLNVNINQSFNDEVGVIGRLIGGSITNLGIAGNSTIGGYESVGGLVGKNQNSTISGSFSNATVNGVSKAGGLVGHNYQQSTTTSITDSYATGDVTGTNNIGNMLGGLVGYNQGGTLLRTYATGKISRADGVTGGYTSVGGLVGSHSGTITQSFFNSSTGGLGTTSTNGTAKTLTQLQTASTYSDWGSNIKSTGTGSATWRIYEGNTSPLLTSYLTALSGTINGTKITKTYDGNNQVNGSITWGTTPNNDLLLGDTSITLSSANVGIYADGTLRSLYSSQLGYDLNVGGTVPEVEITPRAITISADEVSKIYGNSEATLGVTVSTTEGLGLASTDNLSDVTGTLIRESGEDVGSYDVLLGTGSKASNYTITFNEDNNSYSITPRAITISADAVSKIYGNSEETLGATVSTTEGLGLASTDDLADVVGTLTRESGENVGSYDVALGTGTKASNYTITFNEDNNSYSITPRAITISADAVSKIYGNSEETLGATVSTTEGLGLASTDDLADVVGTLTRESGENVGSYDVALGTGTKASNYTITFNEDNNSYSITPRAITIKATDLTKVYGQIDPTLVYTVTSGSIVNDDNLGVNLTRATGEDVNTTTGYAISNNGTFNSNYDVIFVDGKLNITPKPIPPTPEPEVPVDPTPVDPTPKPEVPVEPKPTLPPITPVEEEKVKEIEKVITTIVNTQQVSQPIIPVIVNPIVVNTPIIQPTISGGMSLVSQTIQGQPNQVITLSELRTQNNSSENTNVQTQDVRVFLNGNSIIELVNGGVNLPDGVDQEFYLVREDSNNNGAN
jgi:hypothetical protein